MLTCQKRVRNCLYGLTGYAATHHVRRIATSILPSRTAHGTRRENNIGEHQPNRRDVDSRGSSVRIRRGSVDVEINRRHGWFDSRGKRPSQTRRKDPQFQHKTPFAMRKHLVYLQDPMKLANAVRDYLLEDRHDEARELTEAASRRALVTVSWNHLINWQLTKGETSAALRTFNEMKKRSQTPDAYTYTILLDGLANAVALSHGPSFLGKALSIYESMKAANSPVKPTAIHINAVLKACSRAGDIDAMMGIAAQFDKKGRKGPTSNSYTTILNALTKNLQLGVDPESAIATQRKHIAYARRIWWDVIAGWRDEEILIDEELVCSMGRLLLRGGKKDVDDIFSLLQQTMDLPRQFPALGTKSRDRIEPSRQGQQPATIGDDVFAAKSEQARDDIEVPVGLDKTFGFDDEGEPIQAMPAWDGYLLKDEPKLSKVLEKQGGDSYAKPGRNTLSMIAEALLTLRLKVPMEKYWDLFKKDFRVIPDSANYHAYLRILRVSRASSEVVELLQEMPVGMLETKTFKLAMAACNRDKNNPIAFSNGGKVLDLMEINLKQLDLSVLQLYLELAVGTRSAFTTACEESPTKKFELGRRINRALSRLELTTAAARSSIHFTQSPAMLSQEALKQIHDRRVALLSLSGDMISAYDRLMNHGMVDRAEYALLTNARARVAAFIGREVDKRKVYLARHEDAQEPQAILHEQSLDYHKHAKPDGLVAAKQRMKAMSGRNGLRELSRARTTLDFERKNDYFGQRDAEKLEQDRMVNQDLRKWRAEGFSGPEHLSEQ